VCNRRQEHSFTLRRVDPQAAGRAKSWRESGRSRYREQYAVTTDATCAQVSQRPWVETNIDKKQMLAIHSHNAVDIYYSNGIWFATAVV
jgi:hypothetical protein